MKKAWYAFFLIFLVLAAFLAGYWYSKSSSGDNASTSGRKVLYYVDPMNPGHKYDKPGIAPCGMALEPVYAHSGTTGSGAASSPPGTVHVSLEKQQLIGVKIEQVDRASSTNMIRLLGRVAADERRIFVINATVDGWVTRTYPNSTGSLVRKNEILATFYSPEFLSAGQALLFALGSMDRVQTTGKENPAQKDQLTQFRINLKQYRDSLKNLGMGDMQIDEMIRTRKYMENVNITSPASGFVISRRVSDGQRFDKGTELYRIADLRRVWILVDTYGNESRYFHPGQTVPVRYQGKTINATVSHVLPQFDPATRTLKVRLEADNPGYMLRPDMFVDVEFPVRMPPGITVPADAVLDSGLKKTVFVDRGNGFFEPRKVETGRWFEDRVEIIKGLTPGERIVVSGNFLIDSESRMGMASAGMSGTGSMDPSCGMMVDEGKSKSEGLASEYRGKTYYFCSMECKKKFDKSPGNYVDKSTKSGKPARMEMMPEDMKNGGHHHD